MDQQKNLMEKIGSLLFYVGAAAFVGIFVVVMINGTWPKFLKPVQGWFGFLGNWVGDFAIIIEGLTFVGPGLLLIWFGRSLREHLSQRR